MIRNEKLIKRAEETISEINEAIKSNEDLIVRVNQYKKKAEDNYDVQKVIRFEEIKHILKQNNHGLKQTKKSLMFMIADFTEIDKSTVNAESNIPVTREYLQANYRVSNTFNGVSLNSINDNLPHKLSQHTLNKLVVETFPDVKARKCTNDIKYNMEMII